MSENNSDEEIELLSAIHEHMDELIRQSRPDYKIVVYCDQHLGVQMRLTHSWTLGEYGEASADANTLTIWSCPKPSCQRCYEPLMFGYYTTAMGSRIENSPDKQPRCSHEQLAFMYIGKCEQGRQYLCPFYKCPEKGELVAVAVEDEDVRIPHDPLEGLKSDKRKQHKEMSVFTSFASASGLEIDPGSPTNGNQGFPDIGCTISGNLHWFELGQIISSDVAERINPTRRKQSGGFSFGQESPFLEIVKNKRSKKYETQAAPVELVLHFDLRLGSKDVVVRLIDKHSQLLESLVNDLGCAR